MVPRVGLAHSRVLHQAHCTRPHHGSPHVRSPILANAARSAPAAPSTSHPHSSGGSGPGTAVVQPVPHRLGCGAGRPGRSRSGPGGTHRCRIGALVVTARRRPGRSDQPGLGTAGRSRRAARRFGARPDRTRRPRRPSGRLNSSRSGGDPHRRLLGHDRHRSRPHQRRGAQPRGRRPDAVSGPAHGGGTANARTLGLLGLARPPAGCDGARTRASPPGRRPYGTIR